MQTLHYQQCAVINFSFLKVKNLQLTARQCSQRYSSPDRPADRPAEHPTKFLQVFPLPFTNNTKGCLCHFDIFSAQHIVQETHLLPQAGIHRASWERLVTGLG